MNPKFSLDDLRALISTKKSKNAKLSLPRIIGHWSFVIYIMLLLHHNFGTVEVLVGVLYTDTIYYHLFYSSTHSKALLLYMLLPITDFFSSFFKVGVIWDLPESDEATYIHTLDETTFIHLNVCTFIHYLVMSPYFEMIFGDVWQFHFLKNRKYFAKYFTSFSKNHNVMRYSTNKNRVSYATFN